MAASANSSASRSFCPSSRRNPAIPLLNRCRRNWIMRCGSAPRLSLRSDLNGRIGKLQRIEVILPQQPQKPGDPTPQPVPKELDYEMWLGPAPFAPYTRDRVHFNSRWIWDYSGGII